MRHKTMTKPLNIDDLDRRLRNMNGSGDADELVIISMKNLRLCAEDAEANMQVFWINIETLRENYP